MSNKFVFADPHDCVGCKACMAACLEKHFVPGDVPVPRLRVRQIGDMTAPLLCHHCEDAPCAAVCPTAALYQDGDRVAVDESKCIGCRSCVVACPFGAVEVIERYDLADVGDVRVGTELHAAVSKCDRCVDRKNGPACIEACPHDALHIIDQQTLYAAMGVDVTAAAETPVEELTTTD